MRHTQHEHGLVITRAESSPHLAACAHAENVEEVPVMDFTRLVLLDTPSKSCIGFGVRAFFEAWYPEDQPTALFISANSISPKNASWLSIESKVTLEDSKMARTAVRQQGISQGFSALFVYISTRNDEQLAHTLQRLANDGEQDIVVIAQDDLASFLPVLGLRPSLVATHFKI